jgi:hypothetical protein
MGRPTSDGRGGGLRGLTGDDTDPGPGGGGAPLADIDWQEAAAVAAEDAEGRDATTAQGQLFIAARVCEDWQGDPFAAFEHLEAALARAGGAPLLPVLRGLRDLALEAGSILAATQCLEQEIAATSANERRADLLVEKAVLFADHLLARVD